MELTDLKGVGPKRAALFAELHVYTPEDLLRFYPKEYLDYTSTRNISSLYDGERVSLHVTAAADPTTFFYKGKYIVSLRVSDATGKATLRWMNQPYRMNQFHAGETLYVNGIVSKKRGTVLYNPQIGRECEGIVPIYRSVKGLTQTVIRDSISEMLNRFEVQDPLPAEWITKYDLCELSCALREIHRPSNTESLNRAKRRLSFEDAFLYFTAIRAVKSDRKCRNGFQFRTDGLSDRFLQSLTFTPTDAQIRVMREIACDMGSDQSMNRLIQGDVGSGKTLVAAYALQIAASNNRQAVLLAPTELLAEQHFRTLHDRFPDACLYIGSLPKKLKSEVLCRIESGDAKIVIGTHALLSDNVKFRDLGLVITDEQHRFGVVQRAKMEAKGIRPDVLVMSATPIPRTLALLLYADLDLSVIDQMPPGRKPIKTHFVPNARRKDLYLHLAECAKNGERAYVVCPLIEPTEGFEGLSLEELNDEITKLIPGTAIGVLHGQMLESDKLRTMNAFRDGQISVLIATTVVEVGVDVPEATSMVIEGCEHFGLATLHQLRGRVGRGEKQSHCYLLSDKPNESAKRRIEAMLNSCDGFEIAQVDFEMRGSGDLFGVRQSGDGEMANVLTGCSVEILEHASAAADEVFSLPTVQYNELLELAKTRYRHLNYISHN